MNNLKTLVTEIGNLVKLSIPVVMGIALLGFLWGLAKFIFHSGDENKVEEGKRTMMWGLIALFIMAGVWGIVQFMLSAFGLGAGGIIQIRTL